MAVDHIRYDLLAQQALRGVVRRVLTDAAKSGLPGEHHFFIAFDTQAPGVRLSPRLREQYPQEMTIILQHQFWDLTVNNDGFEVGLSFGGVTERLGVPFEAIKSFFDPSVQFGLQFETQTETVQQDLEHPETPQPLTTAKPARAKPDKRGATAQPASEPAPQPSATPPSEPPAGGAEVVKFDRFRKKEDRGTKRR